jgi:redox-sensitive bicupin YhaK (pirin superfamily)
MKKKIILRTQGRRADIGEYVIERILPNKFIDSIGPFIFLDHVLPVKHNEDEPRKKPTDDGAHPHRGIATLTYILNGEDEHFDSKGNHAKVSSGGVQWMKAGNGIIHSEALNIDASAKDFYTHALQFWINLPHQQKIEPPEYIPLNADEVPKQMLDDKKGWLKVLLGKYENLISRIPDYSEQFLYHIHLVPKKQFSLATEKDLECAIFLPLNDLVVNEITFERGDFVVFDREIGSIEISNKAETAAEIIVFGGEKSSEPIVANGPFVMNRQSEISEAFKDYRAGKYGQINFNQ